MGFNAAIYALSKKYTDNTTDALGGVKGAPATIKSVTEIDGGHRVTFEWTGTSGKKETSTLDVMNGIDGKQGTPGESGKTPVKGIDYFDGKEQFKIQQEHDNRKRDYSKLHNIDLLEIWYYDIEKIEDIMRKALGLQLSA